MEMKQLPIAGAKLISLKRFDDSRGSFAEAFRASWLGHPLPMVQWNVSRSMAGVLRGLHVHQRQTDYWHLVTGSAVAGLALSVCRRLGLPEADCRFVEEAALLHDIGVCRIQAPHLGLERGFPYIMHGIIGRDILEGEGLPRHALVCERHIGVGLTVEDITRQGLPLPQRSAGGHRLYSQRDIETIKWLMKRQAEGLSISRAVELWKEQTASGADPLAGSVQPGFVPAASASLENLRRDWLAACFKFQTGMAEQVLNQAFAVHSVEITCTEVMMRGLHEVGELWHKGLASVQQEHFASEIALRRLETLISASPSPMRMETVLVACPPEEWHTFPSLLTSLFLRRRGWNVVFLGAAVPTERMEETLRALDPKLVVLSAQTLLTAVSLREMARFLNEKDIQAAFGGRVFNHISGLASRIPAHFLGNSIESAIPTIEGLIRNPSPAVAPGALVARRGLSAGFSGSGALSGRGCLVGIVRWSAGSGVWGRR